MSFRDAIFSCCHECGLRYYHKRKPAYYYKLVDYKEGKCDICLQTKQVTDIRHYGYLPLLTETQLIGEHEFPEILRESERLAKLEGR